MILIEIAVGILWLVGVTLMAIGKLFTAASDLALKKANELDQARQESKRQS